MIEEVLEQRHTVIESQSQEHQQEQEDMAVNFLLRSRQNGIFYQHGKIAYLIPIQYTLGYRIAPLRKN